MENQMFCYQCQETAGCSGCTRVGVCGKQPDVAAMQDLLVYVTKGISAVTTTLRQEGVEIQPAVNHMITLNLFTTITNANFSKEAIIARIQETLSEKDLLLSKLNTFTSTDTLPEAALWNGSENEFAAKAATVGILSTENEDIRSLRELITYGLKGLSAYSKHANVLLQDNEEIDAFMQRALAATLDDSLSVDDLIALTLETGKYGVEGMALLDNANTSAYGNPEITKVNIGVGSRPGILVSGHDLRDLEMLLDGYQMKREGSQGQNKTFVLALKLAQFDFLKRTASNTTPMLLLDDIFDKLDAHRVEQIVQLVSGSDFGQIFITDTNRDHLDQILKNVSFDYKLFNVSNGEIKEKEHV